MSRSLSRYTTAEDTDLASGDPLLDHEDLITHTDHLYQRVNITFDRLDRIEMHQEILEDQPDDQVLSIEACSAILEDCGVHQFNLESLGLEDVALEESVGGISSILSRLKQIYLDDHVQMLTKDLPDLFKKRKKGIIAYQKRLRQLKAKLDGKDLKDGKTIKASYAGNMVYEWTANGGFVQSPSKQLDQERKISDHVLYGYHKAVGQDLSDYADLVKGIDASSEQAFEKTVVQPLKKKVAPIEHFKKEYRLSKLMLANSGWTLTGSFKEDQTHMAKLARKRRVRLVRDSLQEVGGVIPDVRMSVKEIHQMIDQALQLGDSTLDFLERSVREIKAQARQTTQTAKVLTKEMRANGDKAIDKKQWRQLVKYGTNLQVNYTKPVSDQTNHNFMVMRAVYMLATALNNQA